MPSTLRYSLTLALLSSLAPLAGCDDNIRYPVDSGTAEEPADAATIPPDAAIEAPDAGQPDGAPARVLVPAHLLGDSPAGNRVIDPGVRAPDSWFAYRLDTGGSATLHRPVFARSPAGMPAMAVDPEGSEAGVLLATFAIGGKGPFEAGLWVGQPTGGSLTTVSIQLQALEVAAPGRFSTMFDLAATMTSKTFEGIRWTRYSATISNEILGWSLLMATNTSSKVLYVTGPELVETPGQAKVGSHGRAPTAVEQEHMRWVLEEARRRMPTSRRLFPEPRFWAPP